MLTRPLGANLGDFLGSDKTEGGLGLGTFGTSVLFLAIILALVIFLSVTKVDRTETRAGEPTGDPDDLDEPEPARA
ncbi:MAG TPA: hypothetical protein VK204_02765 [Nocardioidaceae bacterium]|nr:hypothetical protein [Nocardioidaceae bacterium]